MYKQIPIMSRIHTNRTDVSNNHDQNSQAFSTLQPDINSKSIIYSKIKQAQAIQIEDK